MQMNGMNQCRKWLLNVATFTALLINFALSASAQQRAVNEDIFFETLFKQYPGKFDSVLRHRNDWNVQVIYTQINRGNNGIPSFQHYYFNKKSARYFYPASTVKLPVALLTLQKMHALGRPDISINSTMITEAAYSGQTPVYNDPNTPDGRPTIAQYIKEMLLVSDNNAYNRLYEFLGQQYINEGLKARGYTSAQILHRLGTGLSEDENRHTNPVSFYNEKRQLLLTQPLQANAAVYEKRNDLLGKQFYADTILVNMPMDFSKKNRISLEDLHIMLTGLLFPEKQKQEQRFNISEEERKFLLKYMSQSPGESVYPTYDSSYHDAYVKFILCGSEKGNLPKNMRIFNKVGDAYGQLTDVAYVVDFEKKIEFFVSATIYCNNDGILNDDRYDYDTIGFPFMKALGRALYEFEVKRKKNNLPDLSSLLFTYDK